MAFNPPRPRPPQPEPPNPTPPDPPALTTLEVYVYDQTTTEGIGKALVQHVGGEARETNPNGTAHFDLPIGQQADFAVQKTNYESNTGSAVPGPDLQLPIWLRRTGGSPEPGPTPPPSDRPVRLLEGNASQMGRSFAFGGRPRLVHGCSDFTAMAKFNRNRDEYLRNLDVTAQYQQYTRFGWRCNGWVFPERGLDIDPIRHSWWESAFRGVLEAHRERGLKANVSSFDMNNWSDLQAMESFKRAAQICADYGDTVWLSAVTNEMEGTWAPGETPEHIAQGHKLMDAFRGIYPRGLHAISDPHNRSRDGMKKLAVTAALIHQFGNPIDTGIRRAFNDVYENFPGVPVVQDEPRGPNGPGGGDVTSSVEDPDHLFGLYTMHVIVGCASTYFNNPGCASELPLDSTWGFKELPRLWRDLEIPEDISQGELCAGHEREFMDVNDSHAGRADGMRRGGYGLGVISGKWDGHQWAVKACVDGTWSVWYSGGKWWEGRLSAGQTIPVRGDFKPAVVRAIS